jgi:hypothetical protein
MKNQFLAMKSIALAALLCFIACPGGNDKPKTVSVTGVSLSKTSLTLGGGESQTLSATVAPSNATNNKVLWQSSHTEIASVSIGVVRGRAKGTATITATTDDGSFMATCEVTVVDVYVAGQSDTEAILWKNGVPQVLSGGLLATSVFVSGDVVYVGGESSSRAAVLWKNGVPQTLPDATRALSVFVSGSDVHVAGINGEYLNDRYSARLWKNGVLQNLPGGNYGLASSVFVSGNDVYILGVGEDYIRQQFFNGVWKNNVLLYTFSGYQNFPINGLHGLWVSGNDVYVSGTVGYDDYYGQNYNEPAFWKNGETIPLSTDFLYGSFGSADFVFVFNNDVYTCGFKENASDQFSAPHRGIIWKNREVLLQAYGEYEEYFVYLHSVFVSDK